MDKLTYGLLAFAVLITAVTYYAMSPKPDDKLKKPHHPRKK